MNLLEFNQYLFLNDFAAKCKNIKKKKTYGSLDFHPIIT